jgi:hypothetical protein
MKHARLVIVGFLFLVIALSQPGYTNTRDVGELDLEGIGKVNRDALISYDPHSVITIANDTDFAIDSNGVITNVVSLAVDVYSILVSVNDTCGNTLTGEFTLTVEDTTVPVWDPTPVDQAIDQGESFTYDLNATDLSSLDHWWLNTTVFAIDNNGVITNIEELAVGVYGIRVYVNDTHGNILTGTFSVTVEEVSATSTTSTTTTDTTTTTEPDDIAGLLLAVGGGAGAIVLIIIIIAASKKRGGGA